MLSERKGAVSGYNSHKEIDFGSKLALPALLADFRLITDSNQLRPLDKQLLPLVLAWWGYLVIVLVCLGCLLIDKIRITITDKIIDVFKSRKQ